jgi:rhodanese-related sulfurtransferase
MEAAMIPEMTPRELSDRLKGDHPPLVIDVREPHEYQYCRIDGAQLRPLRQIAAWAWELDRDAEIVLQCHTGHRSAQATLYLQRLGFTKVYNLSGGIDAWSAEVDPSVPRY